VSQLNILIEKLKASGAERVVFVSNELGLAVEGEVQRTLPGGPIHAVTISAAVGELMSQEDIAALTARPRILRHEHEGEEFVLELSRRPNGLAISIRPAARNARSPRREEPSLAQRNAATYTAPQAARASARPPAIEATDVVSALELDVSSRVSVPARPASNVEVPVPPPLPPQRSAPLPIVSPAPAMTDAMAHEIMRLARDVAFETAREAAREAVRAAARDAAPSASMASGSGRSKVSETDRVTRSGPAKMDVLLREMLEVKASDLHLTAGCPPVFRVDGEVHFATERGVLSSEDIASMLDEVMTERARADFESTHDADFAHEIAGLARFRVNAFMDRTGVGAVMRRIPIDILTAEQLGLPQACIDMCKLTKGLVLVTGPTGSGKSTTLAAMIDYINKTRSDHIITIEDPVEFVHKNQKCLVNQREVGQHTASFKQALRAALREDPDIILVGELRDLETISIAIETAETGHLVFGTLHTSTAVGTVDRIIDQFPSDRQAQVRVMLSESLKGVVSQVLVPKISGGRAAALEILVGNHAVSAMIREGKTFQIGSVMQTSKNVGMTTMNESLFTLVQKRLVEPRQAYLKAVDKAGFSTLLRGAGFVVPT
jgi:twitching motility protein PilT